MEIKFQLVPPGNNQANKSKQLVHTFKNKYRGYLQSLTPFLPEILIQSVVTSNNQLGYDVCIEIKPQDLHQPEKIGMHNKSKKISSYAPHGTIK